MKTRDHLIGIRSIAVLPVLLIMMLASINCLSFNVSADWETKNGNTYYTDETGKKATGWQTIDDKKYYFSSKGIMHTGWLKMKSGKTYYFKSDGSMTTGWAKIKGKKYYFDKNGVMATGDVKIGQKIYSFSDDGIMNRQYKDCFVELDNKYYCLDEKGNLQKNTITTCQFADGTEKIFYIGKNGYAISTKKEIDGIYYVFDAKEGVTDYYYPVKIVNKFPGKADESTKVRLGTGYIDWSDFPNSAKCTPTSTGYKVSYSGTIKNITGSTYPLRIYADLYDEKGNIVDNKLIVYTRTFSAGQKLYVDDYVYTDKIISKIELTEINLS